MQGLFQETQADSAWDQLAPLLDEAMAKLRVQDRDALVLRYFQNKSLSEVGTVLGVDEYAAQKRVSRALEKLRELFSKRGAVSSTVIIAGLLSANSVQAAPVALVKSVTSAALAKGAAAGGSTLTLAQSALKLMTWMKVKTALAVGGIVAVLAVGAGYGFSGHAPEGKTTLAGGNVTPRIGFGHSHAVVLAGDGSLWTWGEEDLGWPVLGLKNTRNTTVLRRIGRDNDWTDIAVGWSRNLAIKSDGSVWSWGAKMHEQLRNGAAGTEATPTLQLPGNDWKQVAVGEGHNLALKNDGTLWGWGNNWAGQLGMGDLKESIAPAQIGTDNDWTKIWAGGVQSVGVKSDGSLWFWGSLTGEAKGAGRIPVPKRISDETNWVDVCFGYFTTFAIRGDGTLWTWGRMARVYSKMPDKNPNDAPMQIGAESDWQACACAGGYYTVLLKRDGSVWAMDASDHRMVKADNDYKPVQFNRIELKKDIAAFAAGKDNVGIALTSQGEVWAWGNVLGEHVPADFKGANGLRKIPKFKIWQKPQQLIISDVME